MSGDRAHLQPSRMPSLSWTLGTCLWSRFVQSYLCSSCPHPELPGREAESTLICIPSTRCWGQGPCFLPVLREVVYDPPKSCKGESWMALEGMFPGRGQQLLTTMESQRGDGEHSSSKHWSAPLFPVLGSGDVAGRMTE